MIIGVPAEIKSDEYRVAMLPVGVEELTSRGHQVVVQAGAGLGSGLADHAYLQAGAKMVSNIEDVYAKAQLIVKVKEPQPNEYPLIRADHTLFTYFHFAASRDLTDAMLQSGATCLAYETLEDQQGTLVLVDSNERSGGADEHSRGCQVS